MSKNEKRRSINDKYEVQTSTNGSRRGRIDYDEVQMCTSDNIEAIRSNM